MVDSVNKTPGTGVPADIGPTEQVRQTAAAVAQSVGIAAEEGVTIEQANGEGDPVPGSEHGCETPAPGADPTLKTPMQDLLDKKWDETADIFSLLRFFASENATEMSDLEVQSTQDSNNQFSKLIEGKIELADLKKAQSTFNAWMTGLDGGVKGLTAGGQLATAGNVGHNAATTSAGGVGSDLVGSIKTGLDGRRQQAIDLAEKDLSVFDHSQQGSDKLRGKFGSAFSDAMKALQQVTQDKATSMSAAINGLRDRA